MRRPAIYLPLAGLCLLGLLALGWTSAAAQSPGQVPVDRIMPPYPRLSVTMEILVDGRPVETVEYHGRTYLPVPRLGAEYEIRVRNHGMRRVSAVLSVDGLSALTRRPASTEDAGYIVSAGGSVTIPGWRVDGEHMSVFRFADRDDSYAASVGRPENVGVIGLVAFEEDGPYYRPLERRTVGPQAGDRPAAVPEGYSAGAGVGGTGTAAGHEVHASTYEVPFVRGDHSQRVTVYYDTVENLRRAGVPVDRPQPFPVEDHRWPDPFPGR